MIFDKMRHAGEEELVAVDGIGGVLAQAWMDYICFREKQPDGGPSAGGAEH